MTELTSICPQFLVDDLAAAIDYYRRCLGFTQAIDYGGFYASVQRDGAEIHLKQAAEVSGNREHKRHHEHLDAAITVTDVEGLHAELTERGARITRGLERHPWGGPDFYVEDLDGYIIAFMAD